MLALTYLSAFLVALYALGLIGLSLLGLLILLYFSNG